MAKTRTSFKPGSKRPANAGRKKGSPNKITIDLLETLKAHGYDPAAKQIEIFSLAMAQFKKKTAPNSKSDWGAGTYLSIAEKANAELMKYTYPARKAIEGPNGKELTFKTLVDILTDDESEGGDNGHNAGG